MKPLVSILALSLTFIASAAEAADGAPAAPDALTDARVVTLAEAVGAARAHQPSLDLARGNVTTARGLADQARGALLPQLNASASYQLGTAAFVPQPGGMTQNTPQQTSGVTTIQLWKGALTGSQLI